MDPKTLAAKVLAAKTAGGGNYIKPGKGILVFKHQKTFKGQGGLKYIAEFEVESSQPVISGLEPNLPGTSVTKVEKLFGSDDDVESALGRIKQLQLALAGVPESELTKDQLGKHLENAFEEYPEGKHPLKGARVLYETRSVTTKKTQKEIVGVDFKPAPEVKTA